MNENLSDLLGYVESAQTQQFAMDDFYGRLEKIDQAYYRYQPIVQDGNQEQHTTLLSEQEDDQPLVMPVCISHAESVLAHLSQVYLSNNPIFPVTSSAKNRVVAEMQEQLTQYHAIKAGWHLQLMNFFQDTVKYNLGFIEVGWLPMIDYSFTSVDGITTLDSKATSSIQLLNRLRHVDIYTAFWDTRVHPVDVPEHGDYVGYSEFITKNRLRFLVKLYTDRKEIFSVDLEKMFESTPQSNIEIRKRPIINKDFRSNNPSREMDWESWLGISSKHQSTPSRYKLTTIYFRASRFDFEQLEKINGDDEMDVGVYKALVVNDQHILYLQKILTKSSTLPVLAGQCYQDTHGLAVKSVVENAMPMQDVATEMVNTKLSANRRYVGDRMVYDPNHIKPEDINTRTPAAKIPITGKIKDGKSINDIIYNMPFSTQGGDAIIGDTLNVLQMSEQLGGINSAQQGVFRKGNRTFGEFAEVQQGSDARLNLISQRLNIQVINKIKQHLRANLEYYLKPEDAITIQHSISGQPISVDTEQLSSNASDFVWGDGLNPKSNQTNPDSMQAILQLLMSVPELAQQFHLPELVSHFASSIGVKNIEQYKVTAEELQAKQQQALQQQKAEAQAQEQAKAQAQAQNQQQ